MSIREELSEYAYNTWSGYMEYVFALAEKNKDGTITVPKTLVRKWKRLFKTPYTKLSEKEKNSYRILKADRILEIIDR